MRVLESIQESGQDVAEAALNTLDQEISETQNALDQLKADRDKAKADLHAFLAQIKHIAGELLENNC